MLEVYLSAEVLPVRILLPVVYYALITLVEHPFQQYNSYNLSDRYGRPSVVKTIMFSQIPL
jgi:hypothetical protein